MRYLENVNDTQVIKAGDDSETIRLSARNDNQPVVWGPDDKATVHVDKDGAHVLDFPAQLVQGSNIVTFSSAELASLPAGDYALEVWVDLTGESKQAIWPSSGMLKLTIDRNADSLEGGSITTITLDDFKKQLADAIKSTDEYVKAHATQGPQGRQGEPGKPGQPGQPGKSAYELAVEQGFKGTEAQWLESLSHGPAGKTGDDGKSAYQIAQEHGFKGSEQDWLESLKGQAGKDGSAGASAYEIAKKAGFSGDEAAWLKSLVGPAGTPGQPGKDGSDAYEVAVAQGFKGNKQQWLDSLRGPKGDAGDPGAPGNTPTIKGGTVTALPSGQAPKADLVDNHDGSYTLNLSIPSGPKGDVGGVTTTIEAKLEMGTVATLPAGEKATAALVKSGQDSYVLNLGIPTGPAGQAGKSGADGKPGADGKSAYEVAVEKGFIGTEEQWLASLKGDRGADGKTPVISSASAVALKAGAAPTAKIEKASDGSYALTFGVPAGADGRPGKDGVTPTIKTGAVTKLSTDAQPTANLVDDGNGNYTLTLGIPGGAQGVAGQPGKDGKDGVGTPGKDGKSAYQLAQDEGFKGTLDEWLKSLKGKDGVGGNGSGSHIFISSAVVYDTDATWTTTTDMLTNADKVKPAVGDCVIFSMSSGTVGAGTLKEMMSQITAINGNTITLERNNPVMLTGDDGRSAYQIAQEHGFTGDESAWLASLKGPKGDPGSGSSSNNTAPIMWMCDGNKVYDSSLINVSDLVGAATALGIPVVNATPKRGDYVVYHRGDKNTTVVGIIATVMGSGDTEQVVVAGEYQLKNGTSISNVVRKYHTIYYYDNGALSAKADDNGVMTGDMAVPETLLKGTKSVTPMIGDFVIVLTMDSNDNTYHNVCVINNTESNGTLFDISPTQLAVALPKPQLHKPTMWVDSKSGSKAPIVGAWHSDLIGATESSHPEVGDTVLDSEGGVSQITSCEHDLSDRIWVFTTGNAITTIK